MPDSLQMIPLGGFGEFGMNCALLCFGEETILIDAGLQFPDGDLLGIDAIVPDVSFLKEGNLHLQAILLTHGHEDHMGAVSHLISEIPVPLYGSPLTLGLVTQKLKERKLDQTVSLHTLEPRQPIQFGPFQVEPLHLTHSFPDSLCFAITTPAGVVIWTGDFKFDQTPIDGRLSDVHKLSEYGERGVLALFSDSTNSEFAGLSPSEFSLYDPLRSLFQRAQEKILVSCFASAIHRIQIILDPGSRIWPQSDTPRSQNDFQHQGCSRPWLPSGSSRPSAGPQRFPGQAAAGTGDSLLGKSGRAHVGFKPPGG